MFQEGFMFARLVSFGVVLGMAAPVLAADTPAKPVPPPTPLVTDNEWQGVRDGFGPPDLVIKSADYTMPAQHQDVWWRPMSDIPLTEPRWVRMVEIRPSNLKARKIIHHSIAYLVLNNDPDAVNTLIASGPNRGRFDDDDLVNRRPQLKIGRASCRER